MPNNVKNIIKVDGICKLPLFSKNDGKMVFDFNTIIPMPESLNMESGTITEKAIVYYLAEKCAIPIQCLDEEKKDILRQTVKNLFSQRELAWAQEVFTRVSIEMFNESMVKREKLYTQGKAYVENYQKYGHPVWYGWCIENWGTKWNAYGNEIKDNDTISFETAWSAPQKVIHRLSEMYPDLKIEHWWADEDIGNNTGHSVYQNGQLIYGGRNDNGSSNAYDIYILCWGESNCLYKDDNGNWKVCSCDECSGCGY